MKLYPYSKLKSDNLVILLACARTLAVFGFIFMALTLILLILSIFFVFTTTPEASAGHALPVIFNGVQAVFWLFGFSSFFTALFFFLVSGLCAAVVSFEYKYTHS